MPLARCNGVDLYYEEQGAGPPVVLIAGLASDCLSWQPVRPQLAAEFRVVLPDNRGAGRTRAPGAALSVAAMAADCVALLDHLGIGRAHLVGHSLGGLVAHELAARWPGRVGRVVLAASGEVTPATAGLLGDLAAAREAGMPAELWYRLLFQWLFAPQFLADPARLAEAARLAAEYPFAQAPEAFREQLAAAAAGGPRAGAGLAAEVLIVCGADDRLIAPADSERSFAGSRQRRLVTLPAAAHSLHWDQPEAFAAVVADFLRPAAGTSRR